MSALPRPDAAGVGPGQLQPADAVAVEPDCHEQVLLRPLHLDRLHEPGTGLEGLAGQHQAGVEQVVTPVAQQLAGRLVSGTGHDELRQTVRGQTDGVAELRAAPGAAHGLDGEPVLADERADALVVLLGSQVGLVAQLAHRGLLVVGGPRLP
jgi:hypothetical protein